MTTSYSCILKATRIHSPRFLPANDLIVQTRRRTRASNVPIIKPEERREPWRR